MTTALVVLVDVVATRVPASIAATAIGDMLVRGAPEGQIAALRGEVEQDIAAGRTPEAALLERARARLKLLDVDPLRGHPITPTRIPPF